MAKATQEYFCENFDGAKTVNTYLAQWIFPIYGNTKYALITYCVHQSAAGNILHKTILFPHMIISILYIHRSVILVVYIMSSWLRKAFLELRTCTGQY